MKKVKIYSTILLCALLAACSSITCPLNNMVRARFAFYDANQKVDTLKDTLIVATPRMTGKDSVIINRENYVTDMKLQMSYTNERDTFYMNIIDKDRNRTIDTIVITKTDKMHFESVDCAASFFHTLTGVTYTKHAIDSIVLRNKEVNYDSEKEHFRLYLHPNN